MIIIIITKLNIKNKIEIIILLMKKKNIKNTTLPTCCFLQKKVN